MPPDKEKQSNVGASNPPDETLLDRPPHTEAPHEAPTPVIGKLPDEIAVARFLRTEEQGHYLELESVDGRKSVVTKAQTYNDLMLEASKIFLAEQADTSTIRTISV